MKLFEAAFPIDDEKTCTYYGLSKREYFASMFMQQRLQRNSGTGCWNDKPESAAKSAVRYADELILALKEEEE